jgi:hypothetical protein
MKCSHAAIVAICLCLSGSVPATSALASEMTAFQLVKEGNRFVGEQAQNKVVNIRSEKSVASTVPTIWRVVYYDPTATFKAVEVKFGAGRMIDVKRPLRVLEPITGRDQPLDVSRLKIDSDKAIELASNEPLLQKLTITATAAELARGDTGHPVWKVRLWAARLRKPDQDVNLGELTLSAEDGQVLKNTLRINRVD